MLDITIMLCELNFLKLMFGLPKFFTISSLNRRRNVELQPILITNNILLWILLYFTESTLPSLSISSHYHGERFHDYDYLESFSCHFSRTKINVLLLFSSSITLLTFWIFLHIANDSNKSFINWQMLVLLSTFMRV